MDQKDKKLCGTFQYVRTFTHHTDHTGGDPGQFREGCHGKNWRYRMERKGGYSIYMECKRIQNAGRNCNGKSYPVRIAKNNGAVCFYNEKKQLLLTEKAEEPRFQEGGCNWTFFEWEKSEHLKAKGLLAADFMDVTAKAKYVSYGGKKLRMPLILSEKGYGLAIASKGTVLFCGIRTFGPYIMAEGSQSDYYFISEKNREN